MSRPSVVPAGSKYVLPSDEPEGKRLDDQHEVIVKFACENRLIYDKSVVLSPGDRVLDAGTGSGSWSLALSKQVQETVQIDAVDIFPNMFPKYRPSNVNFLQGSITALSPNWSDTYSFVHQRLLLGGLRAVEWPVVVSEYFRVLRPGGSIQFCELDCPGWNKTPSEQRLVKIWQDLFDVRGLALDCGMRLPRLLQQAGFVDIHLEVKYASVGKQAGEHGILGKNALGGGLRKIKVSVEEEDGLLLSKHEYDELMDKMETEWDEENGGRKLSIIIVYAKKPLA